MNTKIPIVAGRLLIGLVGLLMVFAGTGKAFGFAPAEVVESLAKSNLGGWQQIIGTGAIASGSLLFFRRSLPVGVLVASSYWGGAILLHMTQETSFAVPAGLLIAVWFGWAMVSLASASNTSITQAAVSENMSSVDG